MKTIKLLPIFLLFLSAVSFVSCESSVEPVDPALNVPPENPGGSTTGDYWPMAINNQWVFTQSGVQQAPMKIIGTEQYNGKTYYTYE